MRRLVKTYVSAYGYYLRAYNLKPKDLSYRMATIRMRFGAGAQLVNRGLQLRNQGNLTEALAEFQKATATDPSSLIAREELRRTQAMSRMPAQSDRRIQPRRTRHRHQ